MSRVICALTLCSTLSVASASPYGAEEWALSMAAADVGMLGTAAVAGGPWALLSIYGDGPEDALGAGIAAAVFGTAGAAVGAAGGAWLYGEHVDRGGGLLSGLLTLAGSSAGVMATWGVLSLTDEHGDPLNGAPIIGALAFLTLPALGATAGYLLGAPDQGGSDEPAEVAFNLLTLSGRW